MYREIIEGYGARNPEEGEITARLQSFLESYQGSLTNRKNAEGHFTTSAFVISKSSHCVLMVYHNMLKRYLQPGGHIDPEDESPLDGAKRELMEETGISAEELFYRAVDPSHPLLPFHVDIHPIPKNPSKGEGDHFHFDLQYLFYSDIDLEVQIDRQESGDFSWVEWETFKTLSDGFGKIARKIEALEGASN
ncbi:MAG: NUDIX hydrolase [Tissierellia bacterium]|nr:NUDIX hydrolase [Tissierellia bacterium]